MQRCYQPTNELLVVQGGKYSQDMLPESPNLRSLSLSRKRRRVDGTVAHEDHALVPLTITSSTIEPRDQSEENACLKRQIADKDRQIRLLQAKVKYLREVAEISKGVEQE